MKWSYYLNTKYLLQAQPAVEKLIKAICTFEINSHWEKELRESFGVKKSPRLTQSKKEKIKYWYKKCKYKIKKILKI